MLNVTIVKQWMTPLMANYCAVFDMNCNKSGCGNFTQFNSILLNISGGAAVLQAFGRAADNLLPDLVFSWVTGGQSNQKKPTARLNDEDDEQLEPRIIAGKYHLFWITPPSYA